MRPVRGGIDSKILIMQKGTVDASILLLKLFSMVDLARVDGPSKGWK